MLEEYKDNIVVPFLPKENVGDEIRSTEWPSGLASSISLTEVKHGCVRS